MPIFNQRFEIKKFKGDKILDNVLNFFEDNGIEAIRWAIVDVKNDKLVIEASILED